MGKWMFRDLRADEVECRVALAKKEGVQLLLYKNARCDQTILDETVGSYNWQRRHTRENANCIVALWDAEKGQWIEKEDTGTQSNTEAEKGLASDSFKRACTNWGIGRELYTSPFIWIRAVDCAKLELVEWTDERGKARQKWTCKDPFKVASLTVEDKRITALAIVNEKAGKKVYEWTAAGYSAVKDGKATCDACGGVILPAKRRDGSIWPVEDIIAYGAQGWHKCLCANCIAKELKKDG